MDAYRAWLAPQSGWLPGDDGPEWSGVLDMSGWDWDIGATRMPDGALLFRMSSEPIRGRRRTIVEGSVLPSGASRWSGLVDGGRAGHYKVSMRRAVPPGVVDLPDDRAALAHFALVALSLRLVERRPEPMGADRDYLAVLDAPVE